MRSMSIKILPLLVTGCLLLVITVTPANAEEIGLGVSKSIFDITLLPGSKHNESIKVLNRSRELPLPVNISLNLWDLKENSEDIEFVTAEPALNATRWFDLESKYILAPGEERSINFAIDVPKDVSPGTYLVTMRFQPVLPPTYTKGSKVIPEIATLFFLRVHDLSLDKTAASYKAELLNLQLVSTGGGESSLKNFVAPYARAGVFEDAIKKIIAKVSNAGQYHFVAKGRIEIRNWYGRLVASKELPERYLLPKRSRDIEVEIIPETSPPESASLFRRTLFAIRDLLYVNSYFGPYTATLILQSPVSELDDDTRYIGSIPESKLVLIEQSVSFWVIPWKFWIAPILFIAIVTHFIWRKKDRIKGAFRILTGRSV